MSTATKAQTNAHIEVGREVGHDISTVYVCVLGVVLALCEVWVQPQPMTLGIICP